MSDADKKSLVMVLRSLINSRKDSNIAYLNNDYRDTEGRDIPFQQFGHRSLASFLSSTGEFSVGANQSIFAKASDASEHISKLVAEQNASKKKRRILPQRMVVPQRRIHSSSMGSTMPQSVYSNAYQQMKYRSPSKHPPYQQQRAGYTNYNNYNNNNNYNNYNSYNNNYPKYGYKTHNNNVQPSRTVGSQLPLHSDKPTFVVTFDAGMQPANELAHAAVKAQEARTPSVKIPAALPVSKTQQPRRHSPIPAPAPTPAAPTQQRHSPIQAPAPAAQTQQRHSPIQAPAKQASAVPATREENDLRHILDERSAQQVTERNVQQVSTAKDLRQVLQERNRTVQMPERIPLIGQKADYSTLKMAFSCYQNFPATQLDGRGGLSKIHDRLKQTPPVAVPVVKPTVAAPNPTPPVGVTDFATTSKLSGRLQRFKYSTTTQNTDSDISPEASQSSASSGQSMTTHTGNDANDVVQALAKLCVEQQYAPPEYKIFAIQTTGRVKGNVKVNGITYSTYPHDYDSTIKAKLEAARSALEQLRLVTAQPTFEVCMDPDSEVAMKLYDLLKESSHGVFRRNIPDMFQKTFQLSLPDHWSQIVQNSPQLFTMCESVQGNQIISAITETTEIVDRLNNGFATKAATLPTTAHTSPGTIVANPANGSCSPNTQDVGFVDESNYKNMQKLQLPWSEKHWNLFVTNPKSTVEIWGRLIGPEYSDKIDSLMTDIELDLMQERKRPETLHVGNIYLVVVSECTYRVRIDRNIYAEKRSLCFYIDVGDEEWFAMDMIYECKPEFVKFPAQAICLSLFGLEDFAENPSAKAQLDVALTCKALIGEVLSNRDDYEAQEASDDQVAKVRVGMYDTSSDEDVHLNNVILSMICDSYVAPALQPVGYTNAVISHVDDDGAVFCQLRSASGGLLYVQKLIHHITQFEFNREQHRVSAMATKGDPTAVYLVQDADTTKWYRATVLERNGTKYRMFYIDYGMTRLVDEANVFRLDSLSAALNRYPHQAIKCRLHEINDIPTASIVASLRGYLNANTAAMLKVMSMRSIVPVVKIFIRVNNGPLFCINDSIQLEQEIASSPDVVDDLVVSPFFAPNPVPEIKVVGLAKFDTPRVDDWFEVHVTLAPNPSNFKVRSNKLMPDFYKMMMDLQEHCKTSTDNVPASTVRQGEAYACIQTDGIWYRVVVEKTMGATDFQLCSCDYGELMIVNGSDQLKVLPPAFRVLPQIAMSAKLYGIKPKNHDWETDDCLRFQQLTVDKTFVSKVFSAEKASDGDVWLELTLIDVSTETDINITDLLIDEKRAIAVK